MKAVVLEAPYRFRVEDRPYPELKTGWALIQVQAAGICGSDLHFYTGELPPDPGSVRGHEIAGTIVDPGDTGLEKGLAVVVHPLLGCDACDACRRGQVQLCDNLQAIGGQYSGGFAEYTTAPRQNIHPFNPARLSFKLAALTDCVAVAVHAMNATGLREGESAVVLGDGTIALLLLQAARAVGAEPVILVGKHELTLEIGRRLGATVTCNGVSADAAAVVEEAAGQVDVVFEAVGGPASPLGAGIRMLRKGGRLATLGFTGSTSLAIPWIDLVIGEKKVIGVMGYGTFEGRDEMQQALDLMQAGQFALEPLITHCLPLEGVSAGFEAMLNRSTEPCIKVVVLPRGEAA